MTDGALIRKFATGDQVYTRFWGEEPILRVIGTDCCLVVLNWVVFSFE